MGHPASVRRLLSIAAMCACVAACDGKVYLRDRAFEPGEGDYYQLAEAALKLVERSGPVNVIVVPASADPRARAALKHQRKVIPATELPKGPGVALPKGYFLLQTFTITEREALFEGKLGPVSTGLTAIGIPDCGLTFSVPFYFDGTDWSQPSYKILDCSQSRNWVPKDG
jgi:hypothetical protein